MTSHWPSFCATATVTDLAVAPGGKNLGNVIRDEQSDQLDVGAYNTRCGTRSKF